MRLRLRLRLRLQLSVLASATSRILTSNAIRDHLRPLSRPQFTHELARFTNSRQDIVALDVWSNHCQMIPFLISNDKMGLLLSALIFASLSTFHNCPSVTVWPLISLFWSKMAVQYSIFQNVLTSGVFFANLKLNIA